ncbi:hypothetical protein ACFC1R_36030 [Kitasatospora sp. NPDC056138]|uniref:hypothetical protein n=1 Tax=Kitasatospora sp. NPDC056138 TaxID=3345724 RepID=UPI0035DA8F6F
MALEHHPQPPDSAPTALDESAVPDHERLLACGRPLDQVWKQAHTTTGRPDPHTAHCPYCRQAQQGLTALEQATAALRSAAQPGEQHHLTEQVMQAVRAEMRLGRLLPLDDPALDLQITESAAAKVLRRAADAVLGARAASCRLVPTGDGTAVHMTMTLTVIHGWPLPALADQVRQAVLLAADEELGLVITRVDLHITDLTTPPGNATPQPRADSQP